MAETDHLLCVLLNKLIGELRAQVSILRDACEIVFVSYVHSSSACSSSAEQPIFAPTVHWNAQEPVPENASSAPPAASAPFVFTPATAVPSVLLPVAPAPSADLLTELPSPEALQTMLLQQKANTKMLAEIKDALQRLGQEFHDFQHTPTINNHVRNQQLNQSQKIFNQFLPRR